MALKLWSFRQKLGHVKVREQPASFHDPGPPPLRERSKSGSRLQCAPSPPRPDALKTEPVPLL